MTELDRQTAVASAVQLDSSQGLVLDTLSLGAMIRIFRIKAGLTQDQLAKRMGVRKTSISDTERGGRLPKEGTVIKFISALGLEQDGVGVDLLTQQHQIEQQGRKQNPAILEQYLRDHSNGLVNYTDVARELGLSRRTVSRKHRALLAETPNLALNIRDERVRKDRASRIIALRSARVPNSKIARQLDVKENSVYRVVRKPIEKGEIPRLRGQKRTEEQITEDDANIKDLYDRGRTLREIADELDKPFWLVCDSINKQRKNDGVQRRMAERKPKPTQVFPAVLLTAD